MKKSEKLSYQAAITELQLIMESIQKNEVGIDDLAERIKRAAELVAFCQLKLRETEEEIRRISQPDVE
ncbi:MAG: exodeoxyribonuclease VII small subunit [Saprospiraceae bacterium]